MQKRFARWEKLREKGIVKFILIYGVLFWGIFTAIIFSLAYSYFLQIGTVASFWTILPISLIVFPLSGIAFGYFLWNANEKAYWKSKDSEKDELPDADKSIVNAIRTYEKLIAESPNMTDNQLALTISKTGISLQQAWNIIGLVPILVGRVVMRNMKFKFSPEYEIMNTDGKIVESGNISKHPVAIAFESIIGDVMKSSSVRKIVLLGSEFSIVNDFLKKGAKPENLCFAPVVLYIHDINQSQEPVDSLTSEINTILLELFRAHGVESILQGDWIVFPKLNKKANASIDNEIQESKEAWNLQLDVRFEVEPEKFIIELFVGVGQTRKEAIDSAFNSFTTNSLHVLLAAFYKPNDDQVTEEEWLIGGKLKLVTIGNIGIRGKPPIQGEQLIGWFKQFEEKLKRKDIGIGTHWVRLFYAHMQNKALCLEILIDNNVCEEMQTEMAKVDWPSSEEFYSLRVFLIFRDK